jgi:aldehyde dehydrogenase (NAD+)
MRIYDKLYINGQWVKARGGQSIAVINPATQESIAQVATASVPDVDQAVQAASNAFGHWSSLSATERAGYIQAIADKMLAREEELAVTVTEEMGMPLTLSRDWQVKGPALGMKSYVERAHMMDEVKEGVLATTVREPIGVCALI